MKRFIVFITAVSLFPINSAFSALSAKEIVSKVDEARNPQSDYTILVDVSSYSASRQPKTATYEVLVKGRNKTVIKTLKPVVERGRVLLMLNRDLWAFFPDVTKPIRISLQERLIGEVANGDLARANFSDDYAPKLVKSEKIQGKKYYVLELTAKTPEVTYGKVILWAQEGTFWPLKAEFYAISGRLLKRCSYENFAVLGNKLRPTRLVMEDPITKGKKSILKYSNMQIKALPDKYFAKEYMKKLMQ